MTAKNQSLRIIIITAPDRMEQPWIAELTDVEDVHVLERTALARRGVELVLAQRPEVVIIDREIGECEQIVRHIMGSAPTTMCLTIIAEPDVQSLRRLMTIGARDVIAAPVDFEELIGSIRRISAELARQRAAEAEPQTVAPSRGKLVLVIAPKGGVGVTTVATNVAIALHQVSGSRVALADFSLQFGDVDIHLNLWSKYTIADLIGRSSDIDDATLQRVLSHHESGIDVLLAPHEPETAAQIGELEVNAILDQLLQRYAYVVVDTWSFIDEISGTLMRRADEVLLVTTPELPTLKNAKRFLDLSLRQKLISGQITIVLNRFPSIKGITLEDVQEQLRHQVGANIPSEGQLVTSSSNNGIPVVVSHPKSWVAQSIYTLASRIAGEQVSTISLTPEESRKGKKDQPRRGGFWPLARKSS